jgi:predicted GIY-YIG superfamily endonuclease
MAVYLIHLEKKYKHVQHYIGGTSLTADERFTIHNAGRGAKLLLAVKKAGISFQIARVWEHREWKFEKELKNRKNAKKPCPICSPKKCYDRAK